MKSLTEKSTNQMKKEDFKINGISSHDLANDLAKTFTKLKTIQKYIYRLRKNPIGGFLLDKLGALIDNLVWSLEIKYGTRKKDETKNH